jgi:acyl-CoA thioester hydrolase
MTDEGTYMRRQKGGYFKEIKGAPRPLVASLRVRIAFSDVDAMAVAWHGRYPFYFEQAYAALTRSCGISYHDFFAAGLRAPIVQMHVDYFEPLELEEECIVSARLLWSEGARMNIEYSITKSSGTLAACGYTVQMFTDVQGTPLLIVPPFIEAIRRQWQQGELACMEEK